MPTLFPPTFDTTANIFLAVSKEYRSRRAILFALVFACASVPSSASSDRLVVSADATEVPMLPGEDRTDEADVFNVNSDSIALADRSLDDVIAVRLDGYQELTPSMVIEKGWLISREVGVGGLYTFRTGSSELVLNGVYAPRKDVRIQVSASQNRLDGVLASFGGTDKTIVQTSMVSSVKKQWSKSRALPEAGFAIFTAKAAGAGRQDETKSGLEMGTLAGYMLKLAAVPTYRGTFEVSYQAQTTSYGNLRTAQWRESQGSTSIDYSQSFDDCSQIQGRVTIGAGLNKTDLRYQKGAFSFGFLQARHDEYSDRSVQFNYSVSLDTGRAPSAKCASSPNAPSPFRAIVDATTSRSPFMPSTPVTRPVEPADLPS